MAIQQPIIRGIQSVGSVSVMYQYGGDGQLKVPKSLYGIFNAAGDTAVDAIDTKGGIEVAGFRLDSEFLRANPQIATSALIPILGGGAVALTNNNRSGSLVMQCSKVSTPNGDDGKDADGVALANAKVGAMLASASSAIGALSQNEDGSTNADGSVYDLVTLAQIQQATVGGDSVGAGINIRFRFGGRITSLVFEACTVADVAPIILAGNDAPTYQITWNYLNWGVFFNKDENKFVL